MKKYLLFCVLFITVIFGGCVSHKTPNVYATSKEVSDNLDLKAVASIFGEVRNLEEFERILNDEIEHISNLDLNDDGYTDYLRVVESIEGNVHVIIIQAVLGNDIYQDVATIDVSKDFNNISNIQVIGSPYFYGNNYIIEPVYYHRPYIYDVFWTPSYSAWRSPYYWSFYPNLYRPWRPWPVNRYVSHAYKVRNVKNNYRYTKERISPNGTNIQKLNRRDDFSEKRPQDSFNSRNNNLGNKADLEKSSRNIPRGEQPDSRTNKKRDETRSNPNSDNTSRNSKSKESGSSREKSKLESKEKTEGKSNTKGKSRGSEGTGTSTNKTTKRGN